MGVRFRPRGYALAQWESLTSAPASSPWQRAGDYFRRCEGSGLRRVSVPLSHAVRAAAAAAALCLSRPVRALGRRLRAGRGRRPRCPLPGPVLKERIRDVCRPLGRAWRRAGRPLIRGSSVAVSFLLPARDCLCAGRPRCPSLPGQWRAAGCSLAEARGDRGARPALRGSPGPQQPRGVRAAWLESPRTLGGKDRGDGAGAAAEEGGRQELDGPWK